MSGIGRFGLLKIKICRRHGRARNVPGIFGWRFFWSV